MVAVLRYLDEDVVEVGEELRDSCHCYWSGRCMCVKTLELGTLEQELDLF